MQNFASKCFDWLFWIVTEMLKTSRKSKEIIKKLTEIKGWTDNNEASPDFLEINKWKFCNNLFSEAF